MKELLTRGDKILIVIILILSSLPLLIPFMSSDVEGQKIIVINVDGEIIERIPLEESAESQYYEFPFEVQGKTYSGRLEMKDGQVRLERLPEEIVPKSIHSDMGWISNSNQMIVALPVKMVITIEGEKPPEGEMDIISY